MHLFSVAINLPLGVLRRASGVYVALYAT